MTNPPELWTPTQTAEYLQTTTQVLSDWRTKRRGPTYVKLGRRVLYRANDVLAYVNAGLVQR